jgi:hypothetical protein
MSELGTPLAALPNLALNIGTAQQKLQFEKTASWIAQQSAKIAYLTIEHFVSTAIQF